MRITGNWIGHHGAWSAATTRETKKSTLAAEDGVSPADWRDALPFWAGFAALAAAVVGIDVLIVWMSVPH